MAFLDITGHCPICECEQRFVSEGVWLRDSFLCQSCFSLPRQRALMVVLEMFRPGWRDSVMHESSPVWAGASNKFFKECPNYSFSYYDPTVPVGLPHPTAGWRNENLENLQFPTQAFDIFITQDVFEHVFEPHLAISEIARTLKPGGLHLCTVPLVNENRPSRRRAFRRGGRVEHLIAPDYHGDPIDSSGALVTFDWGFDIASYLDSHSNLHTTIVYIDDLTRGIRAKAIEVLVMQKLVNPATL